MQGYAFTRVLVDGFPTGDSSHESLDVLILFLLGVRQKAFSLQRQLFVSCHVGEWAIDVSVAIPRTDGKFGFHTIFEMPTTYRQKITVGSQVQPDFFHSPISFCFT